MMKAVIMAGGKGTRVKDISSSLPKCLIELNSKTVLEYQLKCLKREGVSDVVLCLGYGSDQVVLYLKDNKNFGMNIDFFVENEELGTSGSLKHLSNLGSDFILIYGDIIFDIYIEKFLSFHLDNNSAVSLFVHPNDHPYDSDLVYHDRNNKIVKFLMKHETKNLIHNCVSSGIFILNSSVLKNIPDGKSDLVNDILPNLLQSDYKLFAYNSCEYVKDMGTPERIHEVEKSLKSGLVYNLNLRKKQKAIFLDRDGVINEEVDHLIDTDNFSFIPNSIEAIKMINKSDYLAIVVTNQPAVAKGFCKVSDIEKIHMHMETELAKEGAKLDSIFFCPCHPEKGFKGENPKYKRDCDCRKPKIGMLEDAMKNYNLDFSSSFIIGDSTRDLMTGKNAGIESYLVDTGYAGRDNIFDIEPNHRSKDLYSAVKEIMLR